MSAFGIGLRVPRRTRPRAIDIAPATSPATPAITTACASCPRRRRRPAGRGRDDAAVGPWSTAARSQPMRSIRCPSPCRIAIARSLACRGDAPEPLRTTTWRPGAPTVDPRGAVESRHEVPAHHGPRGPTSRPPCGFYRCPRLERRRAAIFPQGRYTLIFHSAWRSGCPGRADHNCTQRPIPVAATSATWSIRWTTSTLPAAACRSMA